MNVQQFLRARNIDYELIEHETAYDAQRMAQLLHVPGRAVAKTVLLRADGGYSYILAVLPATRSVDLQRASEFLSGVELQVATEQEVAEHCPDCEVGVLPPFGSQYGMQTLLDESLVEDEFIVFEGNTHREAIRMSFQDFRDLEQPMIGSFSRERVPTGAHGR